MASTILLSRFNVYRSDRGLDSFYKQRQITNPLSPQGLFSSFFTEYQVTVTYRSVQRRQLALVYN